MLYTVCIYVAFVIYQAKKLIHPLLPILWPRSAERCELVPVRLGMSSTRCPQPELAARGVSSRSSHRFASRDLLQKPPGAGFQTPEPSSSLRKRPESLRKAMKRVPHLQEERILKSPHDLSNKRLPASQNKEPPEGPWTHAARLKAHSCGPNGAFVCKIPSKTPRNASERL